MKQIGWLRSRVAYGGMRVAREVAEAGKEGTERVAKEQRWG
jgi:hypothetical protein